MKNMEKIYYQHNSGNLINTHLHIDYDLDPQIIMERDVIDIYYRMNEYGYRTNSFNRNQDNNIMILGCSQAYGSGVPEEYRWGNILANKLNMNEVTLAIPGDSAMSQVRKAFAYFKQFGYPKKIVGLFPLSRIQAPLIFEKNHPSYKNKGYSNFTHLNNNEIHTYYLGEDKFQKYSAAPHNLENVLSKEFAFFFNFSYIYLLEQYCISNNIDLVWSFWENVAFIHDNLEKIKEEYSTFIDTTMVPINILDQGCHAEYSKDQLFDYAADRKSGNWHAHFGLHTHIHFADIFYDRINK